MRSPAWTGTAETTARVASVRVCPNSSVIARTIAPVCWPIFASRRVFYTSGAVEVTTNSSIRIATSLSSTITSRKLTTDGRRIEEAIRRPAI